MPACYYLLATVATAKTAAVDVQRCWQSVIHAIRCKPVCARRKTGRGRRRSAAIPPWLWPTSTVCTALYTSGARSRQPGSSRSSAQRCNGARTPRALYWPLRHMVTVNCAACSRRGIWRRVSVWKRQFLTRVWMGLFSWHVHPAYCRHFPDSYLLRTCTLFRVTLLSSDSRGTCGTPCR